MPNPAVASTYIIFESPDLADVTMEVYDVSGRLVGQQELGPVTQGQHSFSWDCSSCADEPLASGVYIIRLLGGLQADATRVVLLR
jgi:flagellar hook assembly protein FlgD